jgi:excisionase family DNA binding protein
MQSEQPVPMRMSVSDVAKRLQVSQPLVYKMLRAKQIPAVRFGRKWYIPQTAYLKWEARLGEGQ